jgi:hypothetical protein
MPANNNSIISFKDGFNGGTRSNRFVVTPTWPSTINVTSADSQFKIVSASLPAVQVNTITVPYRGRNITFAGDRQYSTWSVGIYDDNNTENLWKAMHKWSEYMDGHYTHLVKNNDYSYQGFQTTWNIKQLGPNGDMDSPIKTIYLYKCWPSVVGEINLNMGEVNFVGFSVTLTFDYLKIQDNYNS